MPLALVGIHRRLASHTVRYSVVAVGKAQGRRTPTTSQHYAKLLSRYARVDVIEVADDEALQRRIPERAYVCLLDSRGKAYTSEAFAGWLEERRQAGPRRLLRDRRRVRDRARARRPQALASAR